MAIESFGESLLSKQRKRQEKQRRKEERSAALQLAGTVGIGLYRQNLLKKQQNFFNGQEARNLKIAYAQGQSISDLTGKEDDRIFSSGKTTGDYYLDQEFQLNKQGLLRQYGNDSKKVKQINDGRYDSAIYEMSKDSARDKTARHEERRRFSREFKTAGTVEDALKLAYKGPKTALEGVFQKFSKEDLDELNLKGLKSTQLGSLLLPANPQQLSKAARLEENYRKFDNMSFAMQQTELEDLPADIIKKREVKVTPNGTVYEIITKEYASGEGRTYKSEVNLLDRDLFEDPEKVQQELADRALRQFNPASSANQNLALNTEGQDQFRRKVRGLGSIDTYKEYEQAVKIYYDLAADERYSVGDDRAAEVQQKLGEYLINSSQMQAAFQPDIAILRDKTKTDQERQTAMNNIATLFASIYDFLPDFNVVVK